MNDTSHMQKWHRFVDASLAASVDAAGSLASISAAVRAIDACAREPSGRAKCSKIMEYDDGGAGGFTDGDAPKGLGKFFK